MIVAYRKIIVMIVFFLFFFSEALLKPQIKVSIWNAKMPENDYVPSKISVNTKHTFTRGKVKFSDYHKTFIVESEISDCPRFLNNIYSSTYYYVSESQENGAVSINILFYNRFITFSLISYIDFHIHSKN